MRVHSRSAKKILVEYDPGELYTLQEAVKTARELYRSLEEDEPDEPISHEARVYNRLRATRLTSITKRHTRLMAAHVGRRVKSSLHIKKKTQRSR